MNYTATTVARTVLESDWWPELLLAAADQYHSVPELVMSRTRDKQTAKARQAIAYVLRERGLSFPAIGHVLDRDHTSMVHAVQTIDNDPQALLDVWPLVQRYAITQPVTRRRPA